MLYGLYLSAAGLQSQEYRQNVQSNNLANAQTVGFKRDLAQAMTRINPGRENPSLQNNASLMDQVPGGGVWSMPTTIDLSQAPLEKTDAPRDVALEGPGFFMIQGKSPSERLLTRDGRFSIGPDGTLVTASTGQAVLDASEQPIKIDPATPLEITTRGEIRQGGTLVAQLAVMNVGKPDDLEKRGGSLLAVKEGRSLQPATIATQVRQGYTENSGVDPMIEMVALLAGQRTFEANAKMIQYQDQTLQQLNTVGRVA